MSRRRFEWSAHVADVARQEAPGGSPHLDGAIARFDRRRRETIEGGDHRIVMGEIEVFEAPGGELLLFLDGSMKRIVR